MGLFDMIGVDGRRLPAAPERPAGPSTAQLEAEQAALYEMNRLRGAVPPVRLPAEEVGALRAYTEFLPGMSVDRPSGLRVAKDGQTLYRPAVPLANLIDTPEQAVYGAAPGYGPVVASEQLETVFDRLESNPGWFNAKQFGREAAKYAQERGGTEPARRESQFLMSPERYEYMQAGPGRAVDLLGQLRDDPQTALHFWNRSKDARTTRDEYGDPLMQGAGSNYGRYQGAGAGALELLGSPLSPIGRYLGTQSIVPAALAHDTRGYPGGARDTLGIAYAADLAKQRYRTGENPILDVPERLPGESEADRADRWRRRESEVVGDIVAMTPPDAAEMSRNTFGAGAPEVSGRVLETLMGFADATAPVSLASAAKAAPGAWLAKEATRAVSRSTGLPMSAARAQMARAARALPETGMLGQGARVAGYRGVPAAAYAEQLRRPGLTNFLPGASGRVAREDLLPDMGVEAAISSTLTQPQRTWGQFLTDPAMDMPESEYQQLLADRRAAAEDAAKRTELATWQNPNEIWNEFSKAQGQLEVPSWAQGAMRAAPDSLRRKVAR